MIGIRISRHYANIADILRTIIVILLNTVDTMEQNDGFLHDGHKRAYSANEPIVRAEVQREYADCLAKAPPSEREQIRAEIERVIAERLEKLAPPDALY
jgi:hypothetical protein